MTHKEAKALGATHYRPYTGQYLKLVGGIVGMWYVLKNEKWHDTINLRFVDKEPL